MDRIKRLSNEILNAHRDKFGTDFFQNKKILENLSIIRSKALKNELAGFITKTIKRNLREKEEQEQQITKSIGEQYQSTGEVSVENTNENSPIEKDPKINSEEKSIEQNHADIK